MNVGEAGRPEAVVDGDLVSAGAVWLADLDVAAFLARDDMVRCTFDMEAGEQAVHQNVINDKKIDIIPVFYNVLIQRIQSSIITFCQQLQLCM